MAMRLDQPPTYLTSVRDQRRAQADSSKPHRSFRLAAAHVADLRDVARGVEETNAGLMCKYLVDHTIATGPDDEEDAIKLHDLEQFCDRYDIWSHPSITTWRVRIRRARRALAKMSEAHEHQHVGVLHVTYGALDPFVRSFDKKHLDFFGELAALVRYTDAVEVKRCEMARLEAVRLSYPTRPASELPDDGLEPEQEQAGESARRAAASRHGIPAHAAEPLADLVRHRDRYEWALRVTSSADALRTALAPFPFPAPKRLDAEPKPAFLGRLEGHEARRAAWDARVASFLVKARGEADRMLEDASRAYQSAWREVGQA